MKTYSIIALALAALPLAQQAEALTIQLGGDRETSSDRHERRDREKRREKREKKRDRREHSELKRDDRPGFRILR